MPRTHRRAHRTAFAGLSAAVAATLLLGACGGSGSDAGKPSGKDGATTTTIVPAAAPGKKANGPAVPSAGCRTLPVGKVTSKKEYLDDSDRWYLLTTPGPEDAKHPRPLVLDFHGLAEGANVHSLMSKMEPFAQRHGFIVALPNGLGPTPHWEVKPDRTGNQDLVFVDAVLDQLEARLCIDTSRVYATGLSNGAFMSSVLACTMDDRFAAIAPVSGLTDPPGCDTSRPVPVLTFHGTADPILLFNGGIRLDGVLDGGKLNGPSEGTSAADVPKADLTGPGYPANVKAWAKRNGCKDHFTDRKVTATVTRRTYDCPADGSVEFLIIDGGGHSWPGSEFSAKVSKIVGKTDMSIDADTLIWDFFQRFQLPTK